MLAIALVALTIALVEIVLGRSILFGILLLLLALALYLPLLLAWTIGAFALLGGLDPVARLSLLLLPPVLVVVLLLALLEKRNAPRRLWALAAPQPRVSWPYRLGVAVGLVGLWLVGGGLLASARERATDAAWADSFEPMDALASRYPKASRNEAAARLAGLAAQLGIELAADRPPAPGDKAVFDGIRNRLAAYLGSQLRRTASGIDPPPVELQALLAIHGSTLEAIRTLLRESAIVWESDVEAYRTPHAELRQMSSVLLLSALENVRSQRPEEAQRDLEAAWSLHDAWRRRPGLIAQLTVLGQDERLMGALRQLTGAPEAWQSRLEGLDYRKPLLRAFQLETRSLSEFARKRQGSLYYVLLSQRMLNDFESGLKRAEAEEAHAKTAFFRYAQAPLEAPYMRLCAADASEGARRTLVALAKEDACTFDAAAFEARTLGERHGWNVMTHGTRPFHGVWKSAGRAAVEAELTRRVLQARALAAAAKDGRWPETLPGPDRTVCSKLRVRYARAADGTASVAADPNPFAAETGTFPLEFRLEKQ